MNIFVLTGANVSAESGLGTFRDNGGLWARFDPMKLATPEAFARALEQVHAFYNMRRQNLLQAEPNEAHRALARLEAGLAERGGRLFLCALMAALAVLLLGLALVAVSRRRRHRIFS